MRAALQSRLLTLASGVLFFLLIVGGGLFVAIDSFQTGRWASAAVTLGCCLLAFFLMLRIFMARWRAISQSEEEAESEQSHEETVWGVGGPALREPGTTAIMKAPKFRG